MLRAVLVPVVVLAAAVTSCGGDERESGAGARATTSTTAEAGPQLEAGEARSPGDTTGATTAGAGAAAGRSSSDDWPAPLPVTHGGRAWSVYLAVEREGPAGADTPKLQQAIADAKAVGYSATSGDVDCDRGAKEALKLDPARKYVGAALYFASEADARRFVALFQPGVVGVAQVETMCAD